MFSKQGKARCRFRRASPCTDDISARSRQPIGLSEVQEGWEASGGHATPTHAAPAACAGITAGWSRKFDEPITVPPRGPRGRSRRLVTLKDAGDYVTRLPKAEHSLPEWQAAMSALMLAARGGPVMLAHIGMMQALHRKRRSPTVHSRDAMTLRLGRVSAQAVADV